MNIFNPWNKAILKQHLECAAAELRLDNSDPLLSDSAGLGLTLQAFEHALELLEKTLDAIQSCKCETGCPACVHSPKCGSGNRPIDKLSALKILEMILTYDKEDTFHEMNAVVVEPLRRDYSHQLYGHKQSISEESLIFDSTLIPKKNLRYGVLDIETRRSAQEVGGWNRADRMGVSCAILYDSKIDTYLEYFQKDIDTLIHDLGKYDLVIGFNIIKFDYKVLSGLCDFDFLSLPTLDILLKVHETLGYRLSLDHLAGQTLGCQKSADGLMALKWWQQGRMDKIIEYCKQDVKVTRDLYIYGKENQFLVFKNKAGHQVRIPVQW